MQAEEVWWNVGAGVGGASEIEIKLEEECD
jgi:hypothetical protein